MNKNFYRVFHNKFRGSRELIKSRFQVYLPFVLPLLNYGSQARALDLGCGRGEWLELLAENDFIAEGVDLDEDLLSSCRELGFKVHTGDALAFLRDMPDSSYAVITGFHVVEHIPFADLQELVLESLRVLTSGGLLILETPNPENLVVGTCSFYLDPTHQRPIPPQLLNFLTQFVGYKRSKILRLQQPPDLIKSSSVTLINVLNGVSPDYAVIAQKEGLQEVTNLLNAPFDAEYGLTLEVLASKYLQQVESRHEGAMRELTQSLELVQQAQALAMQAEVRASQAEAREAKARDQVQLFLTLVQQAQALTEQAEARASQAEVRVKEAETASNMALMQLNAIHASFSWRVTTPLRNLGRAVLWLREKVVIPHPSLKISLFSLRPIALSMLNRCVSYAQKSPRFRGFVIRLINQMPGLAIKLRQIHIESQLITYQSHDARFGSSVVQPEKQTAMHSTNYVKRPSSILISGGINAPQRTPLEAYFHDYRLDD